MQSIASSAAAALNRSLSNPDHIDADLAALLDRQLIPAIVARHLAGDISPMTEWRWRGAGLLPQPIKIRGRCYYRRSELIASIEAMGEEGSADD